MVIQWHTQDGEPPGPKVRAAEYVRMSTDHQQYSTDNQTTAIHVYAEQRGYEIVRSYADEGKSGLNIENRPALRQLLADIESGQADFEALLVYDVSRMGRFQDPDEAAMHELRCRRAGIAVHYCAEQFENDGSIGSSIIKTVKRAMAGEYSRELSVKVYAGQANLIRRGYRQGGAAGFGLRRVLVDKDGVVKGELDRGEQKSIATDRVILVPGPADEIAIVQEIYSTFVLKGRSEREIAAELNGRGIVTDWGRAWTRGTVHQILINEKYIGNNVWGRTSFKLKQRHIQNAPGQWVRADGVFEPLVELTLFQRAQAIIAARSERLSDEQMLDQLRQVLTLRGSLSGLIIDEQDDVPSSSAYRSRFGSLLRAYTLVGFAPRHDYRYVEINRQLRQLHPAIIAQVLDGLQNRGAVVDRDPHTDIVTVNGQFRLSVVVVRSFHTPAGTLRWKLRLDTALKPDLTLAVRMDAGNEVAHDYYLLPRLDMQEALLRLCESNGLSLDAYRFDTLEPLFQLGARQPFRRAA